MALGISVSKRAALLIVVDMQVGLDDPQYGERCNPGCEASVQQLLLAWRSSEQPILFTRHISLRHGSPLARSSDGSSIKQSLGPLQCEPVFEKSVNSAFKNQELLAVVEQANPSVVVVAGMATDACVTATAREAKDLGYTTVVVSEACATFARRGPEGVSYPAATVHQVSLAAMSASGIQVCTVKEVVDLLAC